MCTAVSWLSLIIIFEEVSHWWSETIVKLQKSLHFSNILTHGSLYFWSILDPLPSPPMRCTKLLKVSLAAIFCCLLFWLFFRKCLYCPMSRFKTIEDGSKGTEPFIFIGGYPRSGEIMVNLFSQWMNVICNIQLHIYTWCPFWNVAVKKLNLLLLTRRMNQLGMPWSTIIDWRFQHEGFMSRLIWL